MGEHLDIAASQYFTRILSTSSLVIAGTSQLWRCNNFFSDTTLDWTQNSPAMTYSDGNPVPISAMAFAPSDPSGLIYAFGTEDGQLRIAQRPLGQGFKKQARAFALVLQGVVGPE